MGRLHGKRYTFIERVVDGVLGVVKESGHKDFIVGYRFSPREETDPGFNLEETLWLVDKLADKELDYLHISLTRYDRATDIAKYADKSMLQYVYEKINGRLPLISVGDIHTREDVEAALKYSDIAAIGTGVLIILNGSTKFWLTVTAKSVLKLNQQDRVFTHDCTGDLRLHGNEDPTLIS